MGGGGVIRTVGKVAGIGAVATRGFRGIHHPAPPAEHPARGASLSVHAIVSSKGGSATAGDVSPVAVQRPVWEIDDWEFAGVEGDAIVSSSGEPMPRVVFGAAPSFEEAKAATHELKDALEKVYLSPEASEPGLPIPLGHPSDHPLLSDPEVVSKHLVYGENSLIVPPAPKHAVQAFKLLSQSPAAQNVVASIASDPEVWNAVLRNQALMDFLEAEKSSQNEVEFPSEDSNLKSSVVDGVSEDVVPLKSYDTSAGNSKPGDAGDAVADLFQHIKHAVEDAVEGMKHAVENAVEGTKHAVEEMVGKVSGLFGHIFGQKADGKTEVTARKEDGGSSFVETVVGQSFMGLAVLAILVVILRRG